MSSIGKTRSRRNPLIAYWLLPSFTHVILNDNEIVLYVGVHRPRTKRTKHLDVIKNDPNAYKPKVNISVYTYQGGESIPVYVERIDSIFAGIEILYSAQACNIPLVMDSAAMLLKSWESRDDLSGIIYREFDPKKVNLQDIKGITKQFGYTEQLELDDPIKRPNDIMWLKGSHALMKRPSQNDPSKLNWDLLIVGKDIKHDQIVLGMKKTWKNYARIIPLKSKGVHLITSIMFAIKKRPSIYPLITMTTMRSNIMKGVRAINASGMDLVYCPITLDFNAFLRRLDITKEA
jgi:hypothetical protein